MRIVDSWVAVRAFALLYLAADCHSAGPARAQSLASQGFLRTVAISNQQAAGLPPGVAFSGFFSPHMNRAGDAVFFATLNGPGITGANNHSIWAERNGQLELVAQSGTQAPGTEPGVQFPSFSNAQIIDGSSGIAFISSLAGLGINSTNDRGFWHQSSAGALQLVAREGDTAAGISGAAYSQIFFPQASESAHVMFRSRISGSGITAFNDELLHVTSGATRRTVVREGDAAPQIAPTATFNDTFGLGPFKVSRVNSAGRAGFVSDIAGATITEAVFIEDAALNLQVVARQGQTAPQTEAGTTYSFFNRFHFNAEGLSVFAAGLDGGAITSSNNAGIWVGHGDNGFGLLAREGDLAPGAGANVFDDLTGTSELMLNDNGDVAFRAGVAGPGVTAQNDRALWTNSIDGELRLVAREGDAAPGIAGATFSQVSDFALNEAGQIAFRAPLVGPGITGANDGAIWSEVSPGNLQLFIREGDSLEVAPGDSRTVANVSWATFGDNSSITDDGQIMVRAFFTDGTDSVLMIGVPEPGSGVLATTALLGLFLLAGQRRRAARNPASAGDSPNDAVNQAPRR